MSSITIPTLLVGIVVENNAMSGLEGFGTGFRSYVQAQGTLVNNTNLTDETGKVLNPATPEEIKYASDKLVTGNLPEGQDPVRGLLIAWGAGASVLGGELIVPAAGTVAVIGGSLLGGATDGIKQYLTLELGEKYSATDTLIAAGEGGLTQGKGVIFSTFINTMGAYLGSKVKGEDPTVPMVGNAIGTVLGNKAGEKFTKEMLSKGYSPVTSDVIGTVSGGTIGTAIDFGIEESQKKGDSNEK